MPKLLEEDQKTFNRLIRAQADFFTRSNMARFIGNNQQADWYLREAERCSRDMDEILAKYDENKIITTYINGTTAIGTKEYVERMRKSLTERTVNINVQVVVRPSR